MCLQGPRVFSLVALILHLVVLVLVGVCSICFRFLFICFHFLGNVESALRASLEGNQTGPTMTVRLFPGPTILAHNM